MPKSVLGGRYRVLDKIGIGGMASVFRGMDEVLNRSVAIKVMLEQYANDPSFAARFKQEAQAAAALSSPYIVGIYDWGKDDDTYYIVMELLRGTDLKTGLKNHGALEPRKVAQIGSQICQALTVAHRHDIIHRDIKPQNIMVQPDGNIKVMDFGIARARNSHLTATNSVLGTAHYVSPEQTQGKELGPTSDLYSLGIVMYEAATGRVPFDGDDAISVALKQVNEQPVPPSELNPRVDANLEAIILTCMAKDPAERFQTAEELRRALLDYLSGRVVNIKNGAATAPVPAAATRRNPSPPATQRIATTANTSMAPATGPNRGAAPGGNHSTPKRSHAGIIAAIVIAVIAAIALGVWFFMGQETTQAVPNLVALTRAEAEKAIAQSDFFTLGNVTQEYSDTVERGTVVSQDPESGTKVSRGEAISLVISRGKKPAEEVSVPDLKNKTPEEAQKELESVGLLARAGDSVHADDVEEGRIATQEPAAGETAKVGDTITYHLSSGPETKDVPDVTGLARAEAVSALEEAGFAVAQEETYSNSVAEGLVVSYSPTGAQAPGTTITIQVSLGVQMVTIPNTIGMSEANAKNTLQASGLSVSVVYRNHATQPAGVVAGYDPAGQVAPGTTVTLIVSLGPSSSTNSTNNGTNTGTPGANQGGANPGGAGGGQNSTGGGGQGTGTNTGTQPEPTDPSTPQDPNEGTNGNDGSSGNTYSSPETTSS